MHLLALAVLTLLLAACAKIIKTYTVRRGDLVYTVEIIKESNGTITRVTRFFSGSPAQRLPVRSSDIKDYIEPEDQVIDTDSQTTVIVPKAEAIAVDRNTMFALGGTGETASRVLQLDAASGDIVRSAPLTHELVAGAGLREYGSLYLLASRPLGSSTFAPSVRIVDVTSFAEVGSIPLPTTSIPSAIAVSPDGKSLYVAGSLAATVFTDPTGVALHIIDTTTRTIVKTLTFTGNTGVNNPVLKVTRDSRLVFLTTSAGISVIDTLSQSLSHTVPITSFGNLRFAVNRSATRLYVAPVSSGGSSGVAEYDIATSQPVRHFPVADLSTLRMTLSSDDQRLYISQIPIDPVTRTNDYPELLVFDLETGQIVDRMPYPEPRTAPVTLKSMVAVPLPQ